MIQERGENYSDLFRRAVIDYMLESVTKALRGIALGHLLTIDERMKEAGLKE